jgi:Na+-transporting NADH:ubiquinone oxidoreductase subunit A
MIKVKKGLDLPIEGAPQQKIENGPQVSHVALVGDDVVGMKPSMMVNVGDKVKTGQLVYTDKKTEGVNYTSPASGEIISINRGDKRVFESIVIKVEGDDHVTFNSHKGEDHSLKLQTQLKNLEQSSLQLWIQIH